VLYGDSVSNNINLYDTEQLRLDYLNLIIPVDFKQVVTSWLNSKTFFVFAKLQNMGFKCLNCSEYCHSFDSFIRCMDAIIL
jgi:hypothetical protein